MYVCICHGVTDNEVNAEIALGARTVDDIGERCDAGTGCGACHESIDDLLARAAERRTAGCCGNGCGAACGLPARAGHEFRTPSARRVAGT